MLVPLTAHPSEQDGVAVKELELSYYNGVLGLELL